MIENVEDEEINIIPLINYNKSYSSFDLPGYSPNSEPWGIHPTKPLSQVAFERLVVAAVSPIAGDNGFLPDPPAEISAAEAIVWPDGHRGHDARPKLFDKVSNSWRLMDTGASVSVVPPEEGDKVDSTTLLEAIDGSKIKTYGKKKIFIRLGRKTYTQVCYIADVKESVLGWDFIATNRLNFLWNEWGDLFLQDSKNKAKTLLKHVTLPHKFVPRTSSVSNTSSPLATSASDGISPDHPAAQAFFLSCIKELKDESKTPLDAIDKKYADLIKKYPQLLTPSFNDSSTKHGVLHTINTGQNKPCKAKVRKLMPGSPKEVKGKEAWMELLKLGVIERVKADERTEWSSALHLQPKPCGGLRCCGDFRALNAASTEDNYPLPCLATFTHKLRGAKFFSKIDLKKAFFNVAIHPDSIPKTTVVTPWGTFVFKRLAMGLAGAPASFQRLMDTILQDIPGLYCYLDDIMVYSETEEEHMKTLDRLFKVLHDNGLAIALDKCAFGQEEIEYLGYSVNKSGILPIKRKVEAILKIPEPKTQKELLKFLGAINYFRSCLKGLHVSGKYHNAAELLQPLYALGTCKLQPKMTFSKIWSESGGIRTAFAQAKEMLIQAVQLSHPDPKLPLALTTDASQHSVGAVLEQLSPDGFWEPLGYWSRHLGPEKMAWSVYRKELLAIQHGLRHFLSDFYGRHITIFSDHRPITESFKSSILQENDPVAHRALQEIGMFTKDLRYLEADKNSFADLLSRITPPDKIGDAYTDKIDTLAAVEEAVQVQMITPSQIKAAQDSCQEIIQYKNGKTPKNTKFKMVVFNGVGLYCEDSSVKPRPVIPASLRPLVMQIFHKIGHKGQKESVTRIASEYYWNKMKVQIKNYVKQCLPCQMVKPSKMNTPHVGFFKVPDQRFSHVHVDLVGPLPESKGYKFLLSIICRTSRYIQAVPIKDPTSENCANAFLHHWLSHFGCPSVCTSDNGSSFIAGLWRDMNKTLNIDVKFTALYSPMSNAMVERQHQSLKNSLKTALIDMGNAHQDRWIDQLPWTLLSKRVALQQDIGASASQLTFGGLNPSLPGALLIDPGEPMKNNQLRDLLTNLQRRDNGLAVQTSHHQPEPSKPDATLPPGTTHVMTRQHKTTGLDPNWSGPFPVLEQVSRSQIKIKVGHFKDGSPKIELRRLQDIKPAYLEPGSVNAERPARGRPPTRPPPAPVPELLIPSSSSPPSSSPEPAKNSSTNQQINNQPVVSKQDNSAGNSNFGSYRDALVNRPKRSTRNPNPQYIDSISI